MKVHLCVPGLGVLARAAATASVLLVSSHVADAHALTPIVEAPIVDGAGVTVQPFQLRNAALLDATGNRVIFTSVTENFEDNYWVANSDGSGLRSLGVPTSRGSGRENETGRNAPQNRVLVPDETGVHVGSVVVGRRVRIINSVSGGSSLTPMAAFRADWRPNPPLVETSPVLVPLPQGSGFFFFDDTTGPVRISPDGTARRVAVTVDGRKSRFGNRPLTVALSANQRQVGFCQPSVAKRAGKPGQPGRLGHLDLASGRIELRSVAQSVGYNCAVSDDGTTVVAAIEGRISVLRGNQARTFRLARRWHRAIPSPDGRYAVVCAEWASDRERASVVDLVKRTERPVQGGATCGMRVSRPRQLTAHWLPGGQLILAGRTGIYRVEPRSGSSTRVPGAYEAKRFDVVGSAPDRRVIVVSAYSGEASGELLVVKDGVTAARLTSRPVELQSDDIPIGGPGTEASDGVSVMFAPGSGRFLVAGLAATGRADGARGIYTGDLPDGFDVPWVPSAAGTNAN